MSIARITTVTKSLKPGRCEKCGADLPKGSAYRHFKVGFRSRHKRVRCMSPGCTPRSSELESSMLSEAFAAAESAEDALASAESFEDLTAALEEAAGGIREVAQQYAEAAEAMGEAGAENQERADALESAADELEGFSPSEDETDCEECNGEGEVEITADEDSHGVEPCEACDGTGRVPDLDSARSEAQEALDSIEWP